MSNIWNENDVYPKEDEENTTKMTTTRTIKPFLTTTTTVVNNDSNANKSIIPIYFEEDWNTGIGGGLWSTGLAMAKYFASGKAIRSVESLLLAQQQQELNVLELGSGNGFLAVCFAASLLTQSSSANYVSKLVITDTADHLPLIQQTLEANSHIISIQKDDDDTNNNTRTVQEGTVPTYVVEHRWGEFETINQNNNSTVDSKELSLQDQMKYGTIKFDIIIGSDVAYHETLYEPFIESLDRFSTNSKTICLIGITILDTKPQFFRMLEKNHFIYERLADHLLEPEYRGTTFSIFVIQKKQTLNQHQI